jgi:ABC-type glycerol-3-phosphate transport system substrate-binding protein
MQTSNLRQLRCYVVTLALVLAWTTPSMAATVLQFWHWWLDAPQFEDVVQRFNESHPDIKVESIGLPQQGRESKVIAAMATDARPDILMATRAEVIYFADIKAIIPIEPYLDKLGIDLNQFYPTEVAAFRWDGQLWTLPMPTVGGNESLIFYNRSLLAQAGIPENALNTWTDLEVLARKVNRWENNQLNLLGFDVATYNRYNAILYANAGDLLSPDLRNVQFNNATGIEALEWMVDYTTNFNHGLDALTQFTKGGGLTARFREGKLAAMFSGISKYAGFKKEGQIDFGIALVPYNDRNPNATHRGIAGNLFGWGYVIPADSTPEKRDAALEFIKFLTTSMDGGCRFLQSLGRPSPLRRCNASRIYLDTNPDWDVVGRALESDVPYPMTPVYNDIQTMFDKMYAQIMGQKIPAQQALEDLARRSQAVLDGYWNSK